MSEISNWSTTAGSNTSVNGTSVAEGMAPSGVNNAMREIMAAVRAQWQDGEWFDWGDTVTYSSGTQFTIGSDVTSRYTVNRRIKVTGTSTGTIYGKITASSYSSPNTTVTVSWDSGSMSNETLTAYLALIEPTNPSIDDAAISGLGYLATDNISGLTAETTVDTANDYVALYDASASAVRKVAVTNLGGADEKAKVSSNDTTAGYLNGKLVAGAGITLTEGSDGGNETLTVATTASTVTAGTALEVNPFSTGQKSQAHGLGAAPTWVIGKLVCVTGEKGYSSGDEVSYTTDASVDGNSLTSGADATNVFAYIGGTPKIWDKNTNNNGYITIANWKLVVTPYLLS